jgi:RHS repeat-associated protein
VEKLEVNYADQNTIVAGRRFIYEGWRLIAEYTTSGGAVGSQTLGTLVRSYVWGLDAGGGGGSTGALLQIDDRNTGKAYLTAHDANGNVMALYDASDGSAAAIYEYSPFGEILRTEGTYAKTNPFRFSNQYTDEDTGLVYYGHRYYSPSLGRFINRDPIAELGGLNLYGFCGNDAINGYDVLGLNHNPDHHGNDNPFDLGPGVSTFFDRPNIFTLSDEERAEQKRIEEENRKRVLEGLATYGQHKAVGALLDQAQAESGKEATENAASQPTGSAAANRTVQFLRALADAWEKEGMLLAAGNLRHYLDGLGETQDYDFRVLLEHDEVRSAARENRDRFLFITILGRVASTLSDGESVTISDYWTRAAEGDFKQAFGKFQVASYGKFVVRREGNTFYIEGEVEHYFWDWYDFISSGTALNYLWAIPLEKDGGADPYLNLGRVCRWELYGS